VILTQGDVAAIAAGASRFPWRALGGNGETRIEAATGKAVAWLPEALFDITTHPTGRIWAGKVGKYLVLFTLEGDPSARASEVSAPAPPA
jgi:hypothetical protein